MQTTDYSKDCAIRLHEAYKIVRQSLEMGGVRQEKYRSQTARDNK